MIEFVYALLLHYRLHNEDSQIYLIKADREFGDTFADTRKVTFSYYKLTRIAGGVGGPEYNFVKFKKQLSSHNYCDVNEAFDKEKLSLGKIIASPIP